MVDQFGLVCDSLVRLHPPSAPLAQAMARAIESIERAAAVPPPELADAMRRHGVIPPVIAHVEK